MTSKVSKQPENKAPQVEELNDDDLGQVQGGGDVLKGEVPDRLKIGGVSGEFKNGDNALKSMGDDGTAKTP